MKKKIKIRSLKTIANNHTVYGTRYKAQGKSSKAIRRLHRWIRAEG